MTNKNRVSLFAALMVCMATLQVSTQLAVAQTEQVLYSFSGPNPQSGVTFDSSGNIFGTFGQEVFELSPQAGGGYTETTIYTSAGDTEGAFLRDASGNLYATSIASATNLGTVFELSPSGSSWIETTLYDLPMTGLRGNSLYGDLIFDRVGNIYGTALYGGQYAGGSFFGGTVFELIKLAGGGWTQKVLHSFGNNTDGSEPFAGVVFDTARNLYGTTLYGGTNNLGIVFELVPQANGTWKEQILHTFGSGTDGQNPRGKLIFDSAGNLYGTTTNGGLYGQGIVFELMPQSNGTWKELIPHHFGNGTDGARSFSNLIFDASGSLYGTTFFGGQYGGGVLFKLTPHTGGPWTEAVVYNFFSSGTDASGPIGDILFQAGNIYGTSMEGGTNNEGTVWEVTQ